MSFGKFPHNKKRAIGVEKKNIRVLIIAVIFQGVNDIYTALLLGISCRHMHFFRMFEILHIYENNWETNEHAHTFGLLSELGGVIAKK